MRPFPGSSARGNRLFSLPILMALGSLLAGNCPAQLPDYLLSGPRIMFLGDSITHSGEYVVQLEARLQQLSPTPEVINLGLPSETCSGLSEPTHPFPRPDVHERLDRALDLVRPDVVVACYGINDAIYYPFSEDRFRKYQDGISRLIAKSRTAGAKVILLTPPPFDPLPLKGQGKLRSADHEQFDWRTPYENYDDVIEKYADWVLSQADQVDEVIDIFHPLQKYVQEKRNDDPEFVLAADGVHLNRTGHEVLAHAILGHYSVDTMAVDPQLLELLRKRQTVMHSAWLTEVGHKRPAMKPGLSVEEAQNATALWTKQIEALKPAGG